MLIFDVIFVAGIIAAIVGLARITNGPRGKRGPRQRRQSWLVTAWNASGAKPIEATTLRIASGELAGRVAGGIGRRGKRAGGWLGRRAVAPAGRKARDTAGRAGRSTAERARRRWDARPGKDDRPPLLFRRRPRPQLADPPPPPGRQDPKPPPDELAQRRNAKTQPSPPQPAEQPAPRPQTSGDTVTTPNDTEQPEATTQVVVPPDWALLADRVSNLNPEDDAALAKFMIGEMGGMLTYARALMTAHETCVNTVGLDPSAMQGMAEYSTAAGEAAQKMAGAHRRFLVVYKEVQSAVASGVKLPFKGRWFAGNAS